MRTIERTSRFKRDFRRELKGRYRQTLEKEFTDLLRLLAIDALLPPNFHDHALGGQWSDHRDLHLRPDLVLIYVSHRIPRYS